VTVIGLRRLAPLAVMALIHYCSSLPGTPGSGGVLPGIPSGLHNLLHIPAYALLAGSWLLALPERRSRRALLLAGLLTVGYGVFDEWHQSFVPGRESSAADLLRDAIGAAVGIWLVRRAEGVIAARNHPR
jgi:VanZ family protein